MIVLLCAFIFIVLLVAFLVTIYFALPIHCPYCGHVMRVNELGMLKCPNCGTIFKKEDFL